MINLNKFYILLGKITHLSLQDIPDLFNLKNAKISFLIINMKNYDFIDKQLQFSDPIEGYFECISSCDIKDGTCISRCVEILKECET